MRKVAATDSQQAAGDPIPLTARYPGPNDGDAAAASFPVKAAQRVEALIEQVVAGPGMGQTTNDFAELVLHLAPSVYAHTVRFLSRTKLHETAQSAIISIITAVAKLAGGKQLNPLDLQPVWPRLRRLGLGLMEVEVVSRALQDTVRRKVLLDEVMLASWSCCEQAVMYALRAAFTATPSDSDLVTHSVYHPVTAPASIASGPGSMCSRYQERTQASSKMASFNTEAARIALRSWRKVQAKGVDCGVECTLVKVWRAMTEPWAVSPLFFDLAFIVGHLLSASCVACGARPVPNLCGVAWCWKVQKKKSKKRLWR
eukprot:m.111265 g.111265  ORF g.111265 m.111265 type:complete len:314 (-) comp16112_c0_seq1:2168-3109(-)